jgi:nucleoside-diphosphate-sugar epimerase
MSRPLPRVAVVGGSGRLGAALCRALASSAWDVRVVDRTPPARLSPVADFLAADLASSASLEAALAGVDAVVHVAGLHGAHLAAGASPRAVWNANVDGTANLLRAAVRSEIPRVVFASSTSVYGPGSDAGEPARVLRESTTTSADDVYDLSKLTCERMVRQIRADGQIDTVVLRFGRFWFGNARDYHLRKLSTGVDVEDAAEAVVGVLGSADLPSDVYCVASDLDLDDDERAQLGKDPRAVVDLHAPALVEALTAVGWELPARVGKSVDSAALRGATGYIPRRSLRWWSEQLHVALPASEQSSPRRPRADGSWARARYSGYGAWTHA